jgi:hypothetical protein
VVPLPPSNFPLVSKEVITRFSRLQAFKIKIISYRKYFYNLYYLYFALPIHSSNLSKNLQILYHVIALLANYFCDFSIIIAIDSSTKTPVLMKVW